MPSKTQRDKLVKLFNYIWHSLGTIWFLIQASQRTKNGLAYPQVMSGLVTLLDEERGGPTDSPTTPGHRQYLHEVQSLSALLGLHLLLRETEADGGLL